MINSSNEITFNPYQEDYILYDLPEELDKDPESPTYGLMIKPQSFPCMESSWGTGKTLSAIAKGLILHQESPNNLGMILRKEVTDLRDSTMRDFQTLTDTHINTQTKDVEIYGGVIMFRHASQLDEAVLQNVNLGWFWIEQADELLTDKVFFLLQGRLRRKVKRQTGFLTANAGSEWINKLYPLETKDRFFPLFRANSWENKHNLPKSTLANWYNMRIRKPEMYKQYVLNSREIMTGAVYPEYEKKYHVIPNIQIPKEWQRWRFWDMATSGVVCCYWMAVDMSGNLIFYREYYENNKIVSDHASNVLKLNGDEQIQLNYSCHYAFANTQCDNKQPKPHKLSDEYRDCGIILCPAVNAKDAGIARVRELLRVDKAKMHPFVKGLMGAPKIFFTESCEHIIEQMPRYKKIIRERDIAIKYEYVDIDVHAIDCVRFGAMSRPGPTTIEKVIERDEYGLPVNVDDRMEEAVMASKREEDEVYGYIG